MNLVPVARIENDFDTKFGLPRQSGLNGSLVSRVRLEKDFAREDFIRGIGEFSHLWLIWGFDVKPSKSATVRPPRLGGNERRGVFATRSPFRPNPVGLTVVKLISVDTEGGITLTVSGADMKSGTLIYDIKPYIPYADCVAGASGGFAEEHKGDRLAVVFPEDLLAQIPEGKRAALAEALAEDPRPAYQDDESRVYGFSYGGKDVRFRVEGGTLTVIEIKEN